MTRVVVATTFGGPEALDVRDEVLPAPGVGQVIVQVRAVGVNPIDYKVYSGAFGTDPAKLPMHLGSEAAGVVFSVGADAVGPAGPIEVGDEVIVTSAGAYAEQMLVDGDTVVPRPQNLSWEESAGFMLTAETAYDVLEVVRASPGDTIVVHGASGAVGSATIQLAVERGAAVIGTAGAHNQDAVAALGATPVVYGDGVLDRIRAAAPGGIDAAIDTVGTDEAIDTSLELVSDRTRIVTIAAFGRADTDGFTAVTGDGDSGERRRNARLPLLELANAGKLDVTVAQTFPLDEAARAHRELNGPHPRGKFVLVP